MTESAEPVAVPAAEPAPRRRRTRRPVSVAGVLGELLITAGIGVMLFIGWQLWWNDMVIAGEQSKAAAEISENWIAEDRKARDPDELPPAPADYGDPVVAEVPAAAEAFAVLFVPRFGAEYHRTIAEGTGTGVLNSTRLGIGHYPDTQMPGEVGNFAVAAHRSAYGGGMHLINELRLGDAIYVQTADGFFSYRFRDLEYVAPTRVDVLEPVPGAPDTEAKDRLITLTSCNPLYSTAERIIAYGVFESWRPTSAGPPAELAPILAAQAKG